MRTKREVPVWIAFPLTLAIMAILCAGLYGAGEVANNYARLHPSSRIANLIDWAEGKPSLPANGDIPVSGPVDFQHRVSQALNLLKKEAPRAWETYVKPTLREIQYSGTNRAAFDSSGVINMGWWDTTVLENGVPLKSLNDQFPYTLSQWQDPSDPGYGIAHAILPAKVYNDPRWIASIIAGFTVESANGGPTRMAACVQRKVLEEMGGVYLQYTFPDACGK